MVDLSIVLCRFTRPGICCHRGWKILEPAIELPGTQWRSIGVSKPFQARMQTASRWMMASYQSKCYVFPKDIIGRLIIGVWYHQFYAYIYYTYIYIDKHLLMIYFQKNTYIYKIHVIQYTFDSVTLFLYPHPVNKLNFSGSGCRREAVHSRSAAEKKNDWVLPGAELGWIFAACDMMWHIKCQNCQNIPNWYPCSWNPNCELSLDLQFVVGM
jgi:hypothetical protein